MADTTISGLNELTEAGVDGQADFLPIDDVSSVETKKVKPASIIAPSINGATGKTTPVNADLLGIVDTESSNVLKKLTLTNLKAFLKTYFDTLYSIITHGSTHLSGGSDPIFDQNLQTSADVTFRSVVIGTPGVDPATLGNLRISGNIAARASDADIDIQTSGTGLLKANAKTVLTGVSNLVYTARLTQTGSDAPTLSGEKNSTGMTPAWTYVSPGIYRLRFSGSIASSASKIKTIISTSYSSPDSAKYSAGQDSNTTDVFVKSFDLNLITNFTSSDDILTDAQFQIWVDNA